MLNKRWIIGFSLTGVLLFSGTAFALGSNSPALKTVEQTIGIKPRISETPTVAQPAPKQVPVNPPSNQSGSEAKSLNQSTIPSEEDNRLTDKARPEAENNYQNRSGKPPAERENNRVPDLRAEFGE